MVAQASSLLGRRCGVVGTLGVGEPPSPGRGHAGGQLDYTGLTTPDPRAPATAFAGMRDAGFAACAIEASSIGIVEGRLTGTRVDTAVFTNFTQDHLDYHGSMDASLAGQAGAAGLSGLQHVVLNVDDERLAQLAQELSGGALTSGPSAPSSPRACAPWACTTRPRARASRCRRAPSRSPCTPA